MQLKVIFLEGNEVGNTPLTEAHGPRSDAVQPLKLPAFHSHTYKRTHCAMVGHFMPIERCVDGGEGEERDSE